MVKSLKPNGDFPLPCLIWAEGTSLSGDSNLEMLKNWSMNDAGKFGLWAFWVHHFRLEGHLNPHVPWHDWININRLSFGWEFQLIWCVHDSLEDHDLHVPPVKRIHWSYSYSCLYYFIFICLFPFRFRCLIIIIIIIISSPKWLTYFSGWVPPGSTWSMAIVSSWNPKESWVSSPASPPVHQFMAMSSPSITAANLWISVDVWIIDSCWSNLDVWSKHN